MKPDRTDLVFLVIALVLGVTCVLMKGAEVALDAVGDALGLLLMVLPSLAIGLMIGGMVPQLVSQDRIAKLLGSDSGLRGLVLGALAGAITPGGPFTSFPLVYAIWVAGADAGALVSYLVAWSLIGINRIVIWEMPLLGPEYTALRVLTCLPLPIIGGLIARYVEKHSRLRLQRDLAE